MTPIEPTAEPPAGTNTVDTGTAPVGSVPASSTGASSVAWGIDPVEYSPWEFSAKARPITRETQRLLQDALAARPGTRLGADVFVSSLASVGCETLSLGDRTYVAAGAYVTGTIALGRDCSVNPYTVIRGDVRIGDATRIGAHTSLLGFNHTMTDPTVEFFRQPLVSRGIEIGDDVWIGSHVVVLDGVRVGSRSVLAAGAVVTKDVPEGAIVGGNPARFLKWRIPPQPDAAGSDADDELRVRVGDFADRARDQVRAVLDRAWDGERYRDRPGAAPTVRAWCDAVEVADLLLRDTPPHTDRAALVDLLRGWQDPQTGAVAPLDAHGMPRPASWADEDAAYHVLAVGYALDLLGSSFPHELRLVSELTPDRVPALVDALPWKASAWAAGAWIDAYGTALVWERNVPAGTSDALFGALARIADPTTGLWGSPRDSDGLLQPVNGFYRASRGTFAQHGRPLPYPIAVVDTVLRHVEDERFFAPGRLNACNVLDVAHPLWLTRGTGHRAAEVAATARRLLDAALGMWQDRAGIAFAESADAGVSTPGLQGTEMWLSIIWYLADLLGVSDALGYRPRGVHRPDPRP